ncbi:unnamed protein product [Cochlearia groenlandica]
MICRECENESFEETNGFLYCLECGVQVDDIIATAVDEEDFVGEGGGTRGAVYNPSNTRRQPSQLMLTPSHLVHTHDTVLYSQFRSQLESAVKTPKALSHNEPLELLDFGEGEEAGDVALSYNDYYQETRDRYVKGLLMMITHQCDALVEKFNVTPLIIGLVGPISLRYVSLSGVYNVDWADIAIKDSELQSEVEVRASKRRNRDKEKDQPRNLSGKKAVLIWISHLKKSLPVSSSLAISFLVCHHAKTPVLPTDIVRWAQEGKVPYLSCYLKIQQQMGVRSGACPVEASVMFKPDHIVSAEMLESQAALIADVIGLHMSPVNFYGIVSNYLKQLSIPQEDKVFDQVRLLHNWLLPSDLYLSKNEGRLPSRVCVMSILVVAIRMLYNINGFGVWERSLGYVHDVVSDGQNSPIHDEEVDAELPDFGKATESDTEELLKNLATKYYELPSETVNEDGNDLLSYLSHGKNELFAGSEEASGDDTYITLDKLWNSYTKDKVAELMDCDEPSVPSPCKRKQEKISKENAIRRLKADMRENCLRYIPPRVRVKRQGYLKYARKKEDGALVYPIHADYYILLRACARVAEIDARNMHRSVLSYERGLDWIENKIDQLLLKAIPSKKDK